jgi:hypothetical protein
MPQLSAIGAGGSSSMTPLPFVAGWNWSLALPHEDNLLLSGLPPLHSTTSKAAALTPWMCSCRWCHAVHSMGATPWDNEPRSKIARAQSGSSRALATQTQPERLEPQKPKGPSAAPSASEVHHGVTLRGAQLTFAVLAGAKRVENRHFRMQPGWYALHTGASTSAHESQHALIAAVPGMPSEASLPHSCIVGVIEITHSLDISQCANEPWAFGPVVDVIGSVIRLERPVPHRGALSLWTVQPEAADAVRAQLTSAAVLRNDTTHLPSPTPSECRRACRRSTGDRRRRTGPDRTPRHGGLR